MIIFSKLTIKIEAYNERLKELVSTFITKDISSSPTYIMIINCDNVQIIVKGQSFFFDIEVTKRDMYQIFYFYIYFCKKSRCRAFIHSSIVSKNNESLLILGEFGSGKTTLALELEKNGYEINSSDHSLLEFFDNQLVFLFGTKKLSYNGKIKYLSDFAINKKLPIGFIYIIVGMCDNGLVSIKEITDDFRKEQKIWKYATWVYTTPLKNHSKNIYLQLNTDISEFVKKITKTNIRIFECRGDVKELVKAIKGYEL